MQVTPLETGNREERMGTMQNSSSLLWMQPNFTNAPQNQMF